MSAVAPQSRHLTFCADPGLESADNVREIRPRRGWAALSGFDLAELWRARELLWTLALRDIQVRYKQTALGALWAVLQPLGLMVVLEYVLTVHLGQASNPVARYAKLLPWTFFAASVIAATNSLVNHADMLRKVYFPRLILPLAAVGAPLVDLAIAFVVLAGIVLWSGAAFTWQWLLLPLLMGSTLLAALGVGILASALAVRYRDFRHAVPFLVSVGFFVSGVMYEIPLGSNWQYFNPISGSIAAFSAAVTGQAIDWSGLGASTLVAAICTLIGVFYFSAVQRRFADVI